MRFQRFGRAAAIAVAGTVLLSSCAANEEAPTGEGSGLSGNLVGVGASSQQAGQDRWITDFQTANSGVTINYDPSGSGGGRDAFASGGSDFSGSDRALNEEEIAAGGAGCTEDSGVVELPLYISPIAVIFNLDGVDSLNLDAATIAGIFNGSITSWDAVEVTALNPDATLPAQTITAVHRADDSGTTENFTDYLGQAAPEVWTEEADGVWPEAFGGEAASQTSGMVDAVTSGTGTIGYADASRAGDLGTVAVQVGEDFVEYSPEAAAAIVDESPLAEGRDEFDLAIELDRTSDAAGVYPIVLISYLIACESYSDAAQGELVREYLGYIASDAGQSAAAEAAGSAPISASLSEQVQAAIDAIS